MTAPEGNWIQTTSRARAGSRSCASTARSQSFFDKSWRPSEIELVT